MKLRFAKKKKKKKKNKLDHIRPNSDYVVFSLRPVFEIFLIFTVNLLNHPYAKVEYIGICKIVSNLKAG